MRFELKLDQQSIAEGLRAFLTLLGEDLWLKRAAQLKRELDSGPYRAKIALDYHWLEIGLNTEIEWLACDGSLNENDPMILAALHFAVMIVEVHNRLEPEAQNVLRGRLRNALSAETGFAALFLEMDLAMRIIASGGDVAFPDSQEEGTFDLLGTVAGVEFEIECKSISVDAGRAIHRKDFYRFIEAISPDIDRRRAFQQCFLIISLRDRLPSNTRTQSSLRSMVAQVLKSDLEELVSGDGIQVEKRAVYDGMSPDAFVGPDGPDKLRHFFGLHAHIVGAFTDSGACVVIMKSEREDDTSAPVLEAMRKGASQLSSGRPSYIAVQFQDITPADLMSPSLRYRMGILSYALFGHYQATHVNATYFCGYGAVVKNEDIVSAPAFAVPNPTPAFPIAPPVAPFVTEVTDTEFATLVGAPLPAPNISYFPFQ